MSAFLVTGATGNQGGSAARALLQQGVKVHALVRNPESEAAREIQSSGAVLFEGDLANATAITRALEGVTGIFFNPPYVGPGDTETCETFVNTCARHKDRVNTFVVSTAAGAERYKGGRQDRSNDGLAGYWSKKAGIEELCTAAGFANLTILRPPFLMHSYLPESSTKLFPALQTEHSLVTALKPETKVPHMSAEDVGLFVAAALMDPKKFGGREINLAAENLTASEVAAIMSDVAGIEIKAPVARFEGDEAQDFPSPIKRYHEWANAEDAWIDVANLQEMYGIPLTRLSQFLELHKGKFNRSLGIA